MGLDDCAVPLADAHDAGLYDLDGVLYLAGEPVPHATASVTAALARGLRAAYVTNNASRAPDVVAANLRALGIPAQPHDVVTSAQAAARVLRERLPAGAAVLVVGSDALVAEVAAVGLVPVRADQPSPAGATGEPGPAGPGERVDAVVQGLSHDTSWRDLAEAAVAVRRGALWVAGNADSTYPSPRGPLPGNGAMVAALERATGASPVVAGKPEPALHAESVERVGAQRPLVVGDRLDTDVLGAVRAGSPSLLVLTGVTDLPELLAAPAGTRPSFVAPDLRGLLEPQPPVELAAGVARCGTAVVGADGAVRHPGTGIEELRARCALAWDAADRSG